MRKIYRILGFIAVGVIFMACDAKNENTNMVAGINDTNETVIIDDKNETAVIDVDDVQPIFLTRSPINDSKDISITTNLIIKLSENIIKGTGDIS